MFMGQFRHDANFCSENTLQEAALKWSCVRQVQEYIRSSKQQKQNWNIWCCANNGGSYDPRPMKLSLLQKFLKELMEQRNWEQRKKSQPQQWQESRSQTWNWQNWQQESARSQGQAQKQQESETAQQWSSQEWNWQKWQSEAAQSQGHGQAQEHKEHGQWQMRRPMPESKPWPEEPRPQVEEPGPKTKKLRAELEEPWPEQQPQPELQQPQQTVKLKWSG